MLEIIALSVLIISVFGIGIIIYRKLPLLLEMPNETVQSQFNWKKQLAKIKNLPRLKGFSFEVFLQKTLSKVRILTLKIDNKISNYLQKLRKKSQEDKNRQEDNYWEKVKKSTKS